MRNYELTLVIDPDLTSADQKKLVEKVKKIVEEVEGKVNKTIEWGKKELAYPIKKKKMGYYFLCLLSLPEDGVEKIDKKLKVEEGIIRFLQIKTEN